MKAPGPPLNPWTTFAALIAAAARVLWTHKRLLVFPPLLAAVASLSHLLATLQGWLFIYFSPGEPRAFESFFLSRSGILLWPAAHWFLTWWGTIVVALALAHASLQALREDRVALLPAFGRALARPGRLLASTLLAASLLTAFELADDKDPWLLRAALVLGWLAFTLISVFSVTMMAGERLGTLAAIRRSVVLLRAGWAEGRLGPVGLGLLWVPLIGLQALVFAWIPWPDLEGAFWVVLAVNATFWSLTWLLGRLYAAAVYCYIVEGVVPAPFAGPTFTGLWKVATAQVATAQIATAQIALPPTTRFGAAWARRPPRHVGTLLGVAAAALGALGFSGWKLRRSPPFDRIFPGPAVLVDATNFGQGPRLLASHELVTTQTLISGIAAVRQVRNEKGPVVFVFGSDRLFRLRADLTVIDVLPLPAIAEGVRNLEALELSPGQGILVGTNHIPINDWDDAVIAFDLFGNIVFQRTSPEGDDVEAIAPIRIGEDWGVAVMYGRHHGLCLLDSHGVEKWCNRAVENSEIVSVADCDSDGHDDILSLSIEGDGHLACYDVTGDTIATIGVPRSPRFMRAVDLDGEGRKEIAYLDSNIDSDRLGAWRWDGTPLVQLQIQDRPAGNAGSKAPWHGHTSPIGVRRTPGGQRDLVVVGPGGVLLGLSPSGQRWLAGKNQWEGVVSIDLDGDGAEEILSFERHDGDFPRGRAIVNVWSWQPTAIPARPLTTSFPARPRLAGGFGKGALNPIYAFGRRSRDEWGSLEKMNFTTGCRIGVGAARLHLPAIVQRHRLADDEGLCAKELATLDVSRIDGGADLSWRGCLDGILATFNKYDVAPGMGEVGPLAQNCVADFHQRPRTASRPAAKSAAIAAGKPRGP